ncbi:hypothetical protein KLEP181_gp52 [Paracoccus phage vB_PmaP_KLEP18-1]|nr:hypothetical protein KLEP181_gp52 [Paracoccus phage vB_PmaP_KLEP18-1]
MTDEPRTIWAAPRKHSGWQFAGCTDQPFDGGTRYHHDAVVREREDATYNAAMDKAAEIARGNGAHATASLIRAHRRKP